MRHLLVFSLLSLIACIDFSAAGKKFCAQKDAGFCEDVDGGGGGAAMGGGAATGGGGATGGGATGGGTAGGGSAGGSAVDDGGSDGGVDAGPPPATWARVLGSPTTTVFDVADLDVSGTGRIGIVGSYDGFPDFGDGVGLSSARRRPYFARFSPNGALELSWGFGSGTAGSAGAFAVAMGADQEAYVSVYSDSMAEPLQLPGGAVGTTAIVNAITARFDADGGVPWHTTFAVNGAYAGLAPFDLVLSGQNAVIAGQWSAQLTYTPPNMMLGSGSDDTFWFWYGAANGSFRALDRIRCTFAAGSAEARTAAVDSSGEVYLAGFSEGSCSAPGGAAVGSAVGDTLVVHRLHADAGYAWTTSLPSLAGRTAVVATNGGFIWVSTALSGSYDAGALGAFVADGGNDILLTKLDSSGVVRAHSQLGSSGTETVKAMRYDADGGLWLYGDFAGTGFGAGGALSADSFDGGRDIFLARVNANGVLIDLRTISGTGDEYAGGFAVADRLFTVAGTFSGELKLGDAGLGTAGLTTARGFVGTTVR